VVVQRRHAKDPLTRELERSDLQHHRQSLDDEHPAHDEQHDLLAYDDSNGSQRRAERERTDIAHEYFRRISVEPEKRKPGSRQRSAKNGELARPWNVGEREVLGEH